MIIITDDIEHAKLFYTTLSDWQPYDLSSDEKIRPLIDHLFENSKLYYNHSITNLEWQYLIIKRSSIESQYDIVNELYKANTQLPHGILCVSGKGEKFHGFKDRPWAAPAGNIYLTASFAPDKPIENYGTGFLTLAAVSVVEAIENLPEIESKPGIKWVNDIFIDDAKVCGVLAHTQQEGETVKSAVLGIGLNVLTLPELIPTPFVPKAAALSDYVESLNPGFFTDTFHTLIRIVDHNYKELLKSGYRALLDKYRNRSIIVGRQVDICSDRESTEVEVLRSGIVERIGENIELYLAGQDEPVNRGRLIVRN